ncbi:MAG TPA: Sec-independent protein translocase protein TatB [Xanthobacteraceae bacterium]|jgi:sec-independent protein translocase protein TatB|nr:Sec-independent protein translocase protein TatB [Xanthobacteraceae bacterium]
MFDVGWTKLVLIAIVALIVIGPKELPAVMRTAGQWLGKIRRMAAEFQGQFQEAMREAEMADIKSHVDAIADATRNLGSEFNPLETTRKEIESALDDKKPLPSVEPPVPVETAPADAPSVPAQPTQASEPAVQANPAPEATTAEGRSA